MGRLFIVPQAKVLSGDAAVGRDRGGFGEDQPGTADRAAAQVYQVPVIGQAIHAANTGTSGDTAMRLGRVS